MIAAPVAVMGATASKLIYSTAKSGILLLSNGLGRAGYSSLSDIAASMPTTVVAGGTHKGRWWPARGGSAPPLLGQPLPSARRSAGKYGPWKSRP